MSEEKNPGYNFQRITSFPHEPTKIIRKIFVPTGDVVIKIEDTDITIVEAEIMAVNNQPIFIKSITSATGGVVYVTH